MNVKYIILHTINYENMERKIGEVFNCKNIQLKVVESTPGRPCEDCCFVSTKECYEDKNIKGLCSELYREDNKNIHFRKLDLLF